MTVTEQMLETRVKLAEVGMEAKVAGLGGRIDTLAAAVSGIKDRVDDLATRFTNIPADIAGMKSEISNLPTKDWVTKQFDRQLTRFSGVVAIIGILIGAAFHFIGH